MSTALQSERMRVMLANLLTGAEQVTRKYSACITQVALHVTRKSMCCQAA